MSEKDLAKAISETIRMDNLTTFPSGRKGQDVPKARVADPGKINDRLVVFHHPRSLESEYFRFLKSRIERHFDDTADREDGRIILVTGATIGSGKTTCSLNLALSFAKAYGSLTLYLDADCRNTTSQSYMGRGEKPLPGLSDVLAMRHRAGSVLINSGMSDLLYFPSGKFSETFVDRLRSDELQILLGSLRKRFRYVIVDAPPAFPMPETGILAQQCDGVFIVIGAGRDGREQLETTMESLEDAEILGVILNGVKSTPGNRYGPYGYGYYGKKG